MDTNKERGIKIKFPKVINKFKRKKLSLPDILNPLSHNSKVYLKRDNNLISKEKINNMTTKMRYFHESDNPNQNPLKINFSHNNLENVGDQKNFKRIFSSDFNFLDEGQLKKDLINKNIKILNDDIPKSVTKFPLFKKTNGPITFSFGNKSNNFFMGNTLNFINKKIPCSHAFHKVIMDNIEKKFIEKNILLEKEAMENLLNENKKTIEIDNQFTIKRDLLKDKILKEMNEEDLKKYLIYRESELNFDKEYKRLRISQPEKDIIHNELIKAKNKLGIHISLTNPLSGQSISTKSKNIKDYKEVLKMNPIIEINKGGTLGSIINEPAVIHALWNEDIIESEKISKGLQFHDDDRFKDYLKINKKINYNIEEEFKDKLDDLSDFLKNNV